MAKKPTLTTIVAGYASNTQLNANFEALRDAFDNTISRDGSAPNSMNADLDMNSNDILNASRILVGGVDYLAQANAAKTAAEAAQTAAETAQVGAETAETNAGTSETNAATAATSAAASATAAASSAFAADAAAISAAASEANAALYETNAINAASAAVTFANDASSSASAADASAISAASNEALAVAAKDAANIYATNAATSASTASASATSAATSASAANSAKLDAEAAYDSFDDRYLGDKASDPATDNDGDALVTGALYFNTTSSEMKVYNGAAWAALAGGGAAGALLAANNLSDLTSVPTARTNLGLGTAATTASTDYATAAQGTSADTAFGWGNHASAGYLTSYTETDPVFVASPAGGITAGQITNWNTAYSWGNHAAAGYLTGITGQSIENLSDVYSGMTPSDGQALIYDTTNGWQAETISAGAVNGIFWENDQTVTANYTITNGKNAGSFGPITIASGVTVTVGSGETWTVV